MASRFRTLGVADAGLLGSTSVQDGALAFNAMAEGLANSELRGTTLPILPAGDEERAWRDALTTLVRGFSANRAGDPAGPPDA